MPNHIISGKQFQKMPNGNPDSDKIMFIDTKVWIKIYFNHTSILMNRTGNNIVLSTLEDVN